MQQFWFFLMIFNEFRIFTVTLFYSEKGGNISRQIWGPPLDESLSVVKITGKSKIVT